MLKLTSRVAIVFLITTCWAIMLAGSGHCDGIVTGGLDALETGNSLGPNLLVNGDLRSGIQGWTLNPSCFSLEGSGDTASLRLQEPCAERYPVSKNAFKCPPGIYTISADIKTQTTITVPKGRGGARICLWQSPARGWAPTKPVAGTSDWTTAVKAHAEIADGSTGAFLAGTVGPVSGASWFRNFSLRRELPPPLEIFLLYPNYRGMMFSDQSQVARVAIDVNPPANTTMAQLHVVLEVADPGGKVLSTRRLLPPANGSTVAAVDMGGLPPGLYRLQGYLEGPGDKRILSQSPYTIAKVSSASRASMKAYIDPDNIIHMGGRPRFVIGLYDTTGYGLRPDNYTPRLTGIAKAPVNMMINYFIANGRSEVIYPYTEAMEPFGIFYLATVSAFFPEMGNYPKWARAGNVPADQVIAQYAKGLAVDSRVVGYYTCDECASERQPRTFHQYSLIKQNDPASITFAVENYPNEFQFWRDSVDVLGVDPYVLGTRFPESYVGDMTRKVIAAVHGARPVWTVIQFFWMSRLSHFPTEQELHDMSWMAITEGARGVFYWSYGLRGLDWGKRDPVLRQQRYDELVNVTRGIAALEPVLIAPDSPVLSANSASGAVITKEKDLKDGGRYLISYNHSSNGVTATFTLRRPARTVSVQGENRSIAPDHGGSQFEDAYAPFQAHVYRID
ncbi:MAG: hypothetical protein WBQ86_08585 [Candidatus Binatus sp.]